MEIIREIRNIDSDKIMKYLFPISGIITDYALTIETQCAYNH
jgi:hypothetical protein